MCEFLSFTWFILISVHLLIICHNDRPRKINSIIGPYGFEFKNNKLIKKDGNSPAATPTTPSRDGQGDPTTPSSKKLEKKATPASKKRKVNEVVVDENDAADEEDDNA